VTHYLDPQEESADQQAFDADDLAQDAMELWVALGHDRLPDAAFVAFARTYRAATDAGRAKRCAAATGEPVACWMARFEANRRLAGTAVYA
jgi:hypothetical protein